MPNISSSDPVKVQSNNGRRCLVTGAAGFIGSRLSSQLLANGWEVRGIDGFTDAYDPGEKYQRRDTLASHQRFTMYQGDLVDLALDEITNGVDVVFHLAGRAGVRPSFDLEPRYHHDNVIATQQILRSCNHNEVRRIVYASSSSVYGNAPRPFSETAPTGPISPYGRTKLEAEQLCLANIANGLEAVALRYFTVYGPGQRPDMGIRIFAEAALENRPIRLFGDGTQIRDFTYVDDIVDATIRAADAPASGLAINVGGGSTVNLLEVLSMLEELVGWELKVDKPDFARGDVFGTEADLTRAKALLGFEAKVPFKQGLAQEFFWVKNRLAITAGVSQ